MNSIKIIRERISGVGLGDDPKYRFLLGPEGLSITAQEKSELEKIGLAAAEYLDFTDDWYEQVAGFNYAGSWLASVLDTGTPKTRTGYRDRSAFLDKRPITFMVDTVYTTHGWRVVEVDVTNRNAMGYPLIMRYLYDLPGIWRGLDQEWRTRGWEGVVQIMARQHRFYEPYFRYFLNAIGGELVKEDDLEAWLTKTDGAPTKLLDLPILYLKQPLKGKVMHQAKQKSTIGIPPKHYLSSKALLTLPWEMNRARALSLRAFLPEGRLLCNTRPLPSGNFFVKMLQSGGAHGTFYNDTERLQTLHRERKPKAIWQQALPLAERWVSYLNEAEETIVGSFYVRISLFVNQHGEVVDADATCSQDVIVHGSTRSVMTVPVLCSP